MAGVKNEDVPDVFKFMTDIWRFMKRFWLPEDNEEYWKDISCESRKLLDEYRQDFCVALVCFVLEYLKWKYKKNKGKTKLDFNTWLYVDRAELAKTKRAKLFEEKWKNDREKKLE